MAATIAAGAWLVGRIGVQRVVDRAVELAAVLPVRDDLQFPNRYCRKILVIHKFF
jgi:hypothetical protein